VDRIHRYEIHITLYSCCQCVRRHSEAERTRVLTNQRHLRKERNQTLVRRYVTDSLYIPHRSANGSESNTSPGTFVARIPVVGNTAT